MQYAAVHQFHSGTAVGDAVTQQMLQVQQHLRAMGLRSTIFAEHVEARLAHRIESIHDYQGSADHLLLFHHSMGSDAFDDVMCLPDDIVAVYHNITPERYLTDPGVRRYARLGREQLELLARRACGGVAVSNYNRREMLAVGFRQVDVLPARTDFKTFTEIAAPDSFRSTDWLFVGRIVENKCQHGLVRAFAAYTRSFDANARLVLIGDTSHTAYVDFVRAEAARLRVADRIAVLGKVPEAKLRSAYAGAGVFVSLSEHEGFGVPILEAMAAGLPVVALGAAAIPETMGGAGILLRRNDPAIVASIVQSVRADPDLRGRLVERQRRRVAEVQAFEPHLLLERVIRKAAGIDLPLEVQVQGPFETSYSLAVLNRRLATGLARIPRHSVSIFATEGPGDYRPNDDDLNRLPDAAALFKRSASIRYPDVVIRQMWPPRVIDSPGGMTLEYFGWEESRVPPAIVHDFNQYLDGIGVMSRFVAESLRDSGVDVPIRVVGVGVDLHDPTISVDAPELDDLRSFRFLHISSAFPRKGVDVLLEAYFEEFDGSSDVSLVVKTFPNPHNEVGALLQRLRDAHPNPPDVRWMNRDLTERQTTGLYNIASCYVHPARGEGFGLPVAEAMAAGVPVITLEYSGLADFVSAETAITIPFSVEPARTHLGVPGSMWAEPDRDQLAIEMRKLLVNPEDPQVQKRVCAARELIRSDFSWDATVGRWAAFIGDTERGAENVRVAMVTTWNSRCGIAEYTGYLASGAGNLFDLEIFSNKGVQVLDPAAEAGVIRCWVNRWEPDLGELGDAIMQSETDVVHVQFNFGFFELGRLARLIERQLEERGVVVTLHRTKDIEIDGSIVGLSSIVSTLAKVDCLIVHQEADRDRLHEMGLVDNVRVVAQGVGSSPGVTSMQARAALGLGNRPIISTFGFLLPHKGFLDLLETLANLRNEFPDICLVAPCARHPDDHSGYEEMVRAQIEDCGLQGNVILLTDFLPDRTARALLAAADVVVLPYRHTEESSSAALRFVLPVGRPIVATDLAIFADARDALVLVAPADPIALEDAVRRVIVDPALQNDLADRALGAARRFRWSRSVADHREIYAAARTACRERRTAKDLRQSR